MRIISTRIPLCWALRIASLCFACLVASLRFALFIVFGRKQCLISTQLSLSLQRDLNAFGISMLNCAVGNKTEKERKK